MKGKSLMAVVTLLLFLMMASWAGGSETPGAVYTMTNGPDGNEIVVFERNAKGLLTVTDSVPTGGDGSGGALDPLGSQGSLLLSKDRRWLLAVNAGSNEISVFRVVSDGLTLVDTAPSGGDYPVSVTIFHDLVYVLNAGSPNITGFNLSHTGELLPLGGSTRALAGDFAQVGFSPQGRELVVTDKANHEVLVFSVGQDGLPGTVPEISPASGLVPFGFMFDPREHLLVSEAGSGAVSSYGILADLTLAVISPSVANGQNATCWIAGNGKYAFTTNTGSGTISAYGIHPGKGSLALLEAVAGTGNLPIDLDVTTNGRFLYVLNAGDGSIGMFRINAEGRLIDLGAAAGGNLEIFAQGLAAW